jgi:hypothetical protein
MSKVVNLNKFRKQKAKLEKERKAEHNRRLHGRSKAERQRDAAQKRKLEKQIDGARLVEQADDPPREPPERSD